VACAVALAFTGCTNSTSGSTSSSSNGGKSSASAGTLTTASITGGDSDAFKAVIDAFEKKTGAKVSMTASGTDSYQTTLRTQLSSGTGPDVFFVWPGEGNPMTVDTVAKAGYVKDLSSMSFVQNIPAGFKPVLTVDGKTYTAPVTSAAIGALYNVTAMKKNGWATPTTWDQVISLCHAASKKGLSAFALGDATGWNTQLTSYALAPTLVYGPNPDFAAQMAAGKATFAGSAWVTVFEKYQEMNKEGCFQKDPLGTTYENALKLVGTGKAMASVQVNASLVAVSQAAASGTTLDLAPLPATNDPSQTEMAVAMGSSYAINAKTKNLALAEKFIDFLTSPEGTKIYVDSVKGMPAIPDPGITLDPALSTVEKYVKDGKTYTFMDQQWPNAEVQQTHFTVIQQLLSGKTTPKKAAEAMDKSYAKGSGN
jgi:raffinose/stachyose/melibiose transport system substrate-binding protein